MKNSLEQETTQNSIESLNIWKRIPRKLYLSSVYVVQRFIKFIGKAWHGTDEIIYYKRRIRFLERLLDKKEEECIYFRSKLMQVLRLPDDNIQTSATGKGYKPLGGRKTLSQLLAEAEERNKTPNA